MSGVRDEVNSMLAPQSKARDKQPRLPDPSSTIAPRLPDHQTPRTHRVTAKPILGGLYHEYYLAAVAA
jgi:hypothetical protein